MTLPTRSLGLFIFALARVRFRLALVALVLLGAPFIAGAARADTGRLSYFFDTDRNLATGCSASTPEGAVTGMELELAVTVDLASRVVSSASLASCSGSGSGSFGTPVELTDPFAPPWGVGAGNGVGGSELIEAYVPLSNLPTSGVVHIAASFATPSGGDAVLLSSGAPIALPVAPVGVPLLPGWGATFALIVLLCASAVWLRYRGDPRLLAPLLLILVVGAPLAVRAALGDGVLRTWGAQLALANDPIADGTTGLDIVALYSWVDLQRGVLLLRADASTACSAPAPNDPSCDGVDDDCDGVHDEDFVPSCAGTNRQTCEAGQLETTDCSDGDFCSGEESCTGLGVCTTGVPPDPSDGNACTVDTCDPMLGILHAPAPDGTSCSDGNVCNGHEVCNASGGCTAGQSLDVDDGDPCTLDLCHPTQGVQHPPAPAGTSCEDGDLCNGPDACDGNGECVGSDLGVPDDGDPCTLTYCDPETGPFTVQCTPADPTLASTVGTTLAFLYSGADAPQTGVAPGAIDSVRAGLISGHVMDRFGEALPGVSITVLHHPELGQTTTRGDGNFDLVVDAAAPVVLVYRKEGYLEAQRQVSLDWGGYVEAAPVALVGLDFAVTSIEADVSFYQTARGSVVTDTEGSRQATLLFPPGTQATLQLSDGLTEPMESLLVRATEFTVGALGDEAMPAELPPTSGYTYAVELSVDEALSRGARRVSFSEPVPFYLENFLNIPVGTLIPAGYYDREAGQWRASANGRVLRILSITAGTANIDADGNGTADTDVQLEALGITLDERRALVATYAAGVTLWRTPISHFTPWDCNFPYGPPVAGCAPSMSCAATPDPSAPTPLPDPCEAAGSIIECQNQVLRESIPIAGTAFSLEYSSDRVDGYRADETLRIPVTGTTTIPGGPTRAELVISIAGRTFTESFGVAPNQTHTFTWDGKDKMGRLLQGAQAATVRRGYTYDAVYMRPREMAQAFAQLSGVRLTGNRARRQVTLWSVTEHDLGGWSAQASALGGWSLNDHHAYDPHRRVIIRGDGREENPDVVTGVAIRTVAGTGQPGVSGDGPSATRAALSQPSGIAVAQDGSLYIADTLANRIRRVAPDGSISTLTGNEHNLLVNPGNEAPIAAPNQIPGWTVVSGTGWGARGATPPPFEGSQYFFAGVVSQAELRQDVDVSAYMASIDAGAQPFAFEGYVTSFTQTPLDGSRIIVEYRDAANLAVLSTYDSGEVQHPDTWLPLSDVRTAPAGARWIRVRLLAIRHSGSNNDGYFDAISLRAGNIPAPIASLNGPTGLALTADGSLLVAETNAHRIRKIDPNGIITTVAGTGISGFAGDGGPATAALLARPTAIAAAPDGSVYVADTNNRRVRKISPDGIITTLTGDGTTTSSGDGGPAHLAGLGTPEGVAVTPDGSVIITVSSHNRIRAVGTDGIIRLFGAGAGSGYSGDGGLATAARVNEPTSVAASADGTVVFTDSVNQRLRAILPNRRIITLAGTGAAAYNGDGGPALASALRDPAQASYGPDGALYVADANNHRVRRIGTPLRPGFAQSDLLVAARDGSEVYRFSALGQHLQTLHPLTGAPLLTFEYDDERRLVRIVDADDLTTTIERDTDGTPLAIVGPYGQRTVLAMNTAGYLESVTNPEGEMFELEYDPDGLLTRFENPRDAASVLDYDALGRLILDEDATGAPIDLSLTEQATGRTVQHQTPLGRNTTYAVQHLPTGAEQRTTTFPDATQSVSERRDDGTATVTLPDGTLITTTETPDPRWGTAAPTVSQVTRLLSGLEKTVTSARTATLDDPDDPFSLLTETETTTVNGRSYQSSFDATTRVYTLTSPASRRTFRTIDAQGRTTRLQVDGVLPIDLVYDTDGRLETVTQGNRITNYDYTAGGAAKGYLERITDALNVATTSTNDSVGRPLTSTRAATTTAFGWDAASNLERITPPGQPEHQMLHTPLDQLETYQPPLAGLPVAHTSYLYDDDRALVREERPDGIVLLRTHEPATGKLDTLGFGSSFIDYNYYGNTPGPGVAPGRLSTILGPYGVNLAFAYSGPLTTSMTWSGAIQGSVAWTHDTDFRPITETVAGSTGSGTTHFGYDTDSLLTCASPTSCAPPSTDSLIITRDPQNGRVTTITLGNVVETMTYNAFGELATKTATFLGNEIYRVEYDTPAHPRDALGRVTRKLEIIEGVSRTEDYAYDDLGRLTDATIDGTSLEHWDYDDNGNRIAASGQFGTISADYDDQDRILSYDDFVFVHGPNGELQSKTNTVSGETWNFAYDALGNLLGVELPNGDLIEYLVDGLGRRVGKRKNGVLLQQWVYRDSLKPVAELNGSGALVAQFAYGSSELVPDQVVRSGTVHRVLCDQLGSVRLVVDSVTGTVAQRLQHDAIGNVLENTPSAFVPFGFAGGIYDADTALARLGAREYDSILGRWTSKDPIRFGGDGPNLYGYSIGDPVNLIDMTGNTAIPVAIPWWGPLIAGGGAGALLGGLPGAVVGACVGVLFLSTGDNAPVGEGAGTGEAETWAASRSWKCEAKCNVDNLGTQVTGSGSGSSQDAACKAAKKDANSKIPQGSYKRHCKCDCWR